MIGSPGMTVVPAVAPAGPAAMAGAVATGRPDGAAGRVLAACRRVTAAFLVACRPAGAAVPPGSTLSATAGSAPLLTKPTTPWPASGPGYSWALTEKLGTESPPIVDSTPPAYLVTTSTWPLKTTQSPGSG